jgi:hypothetical protein
MPVSEEQPTPRAEWLTEKETRFTPIGIASGAKQSLFSSWLPPHSLFLGSEPKKQSKKQIILFKRRPEIDINIIYLYKTIAHWFHVEHEFVSGGIFLSRAPARFGLTFARKNPKI